MVNDQFNNIPVKAIIYTAAMLTLLNRKYVENHNADHETFKLWGIGDILY